MKTIVIMGKEEMSINKLDSLRAYDSVRGTFEEGPEMYPGVGFKERTHTQVCVVNPDCIKGYFSPRAVEESYTLP